MNGFTIETVTLDEATRTLIPAGAFSLVDEVCKLACKFQADMKAQGTLTPLVQGMVYEIVMHASRLSQSVIDGSFQTVDRQAVRESMINALAEAEAAIVAEHEYLKHNG